MSEERKPGYQFSCTVELGQGKQTQIIGNFYKDASPAEMNGELDKVWEVLARQRVRELELPTAQQEVHDQKMMLERLLGDVAPLRMKSQAGRINASEKANLENQEATIKRLQENIPKGEAFVEELGKKAA